MLVCFGSIGAKGLLREFELRVCFESMGSKGYRRCDWSIDSAVYRM